MRLSFRRQAGLLGCLCATLFMSCWTEGETNCSVIREQHPWCPSYQELRADAGDADVLMDADDVADADAPGMDVPDVNDLGCDGTSCDGACVNLQNDPRHCGECGRVCPGGAHGTAVCEAGRCVLRCDSGWDNCRATEDGCETDLNTTVASCGQCGRGCDAGANQDASCATGVCRVACAPNFADCDDAGPNGCEANTQTDGLHCGGCGMTCSDAGVAEGGCQGGRCVRPVCMPARGNCDGMNETGCEVTLTNNRVHCGACGNGCTNGEVCFGLSCCGNQAGQRCAPTGSDSGVPPCCAPFWTCRGNQCCGEPAAPCDAGGQCCSGTCDSDGGCT